MTHSPLNDRDAIFAIVPVPTLGQAPANAIATGSMSAVMERIADSKARAEAEALLARAGEAAAELEQQQQREQAVFVEDARKFADGIADLTRRIEALEQSCEARRALDALSEVTQQMLALPPDAPDPDAPDLEVPDGDTHVPSGDLHDLPPKDRPEQLGQTATSDAGGVALSYPSVPLSYVRGADHQRDQAEIPEAPSAPSGPSGIVARQPVAVSLTQE